MILPERGGYCPYTLNLIFFFLSFYMLCYFFPITFVLFSPFCHSSGYFETDELFLPSSFLSWIHICSHLLYKKDKNVDKNE